MPILMQLLLLGELDLLNVKGVEVLAEAARVEIRVWGQKQFPCQLGVVRFAGTFWTSRLALRVERNI
tara:strand:+ start:3275 stop:3475 length:201 start_codon:yes stop_codon:yes gene_type:complete